MSDERLLANLAREVRYLRARVGELEDRMADVAPVLTAAKPDDVTPDATGCAHPTTIHDVGGVLCVQCGASLQETH